MMNPIPNTQYPILKNRNGRRLRTADCGLWTVLLLVGALILTGCGREKTAEETTKIPVSAIVVEPGTLREVLFYVGDIKAKDEAVVYPKVSGKVMEEVAKEGDAIKKGGVIVYIDRDEVGFQYEKAPVESPIDGIVGRVNVEKGENVTTQTPVALIVNIDEVKVKADVIERELPKINLGQVAEIKVDAYSELVFEGVVDMISPVVNISSRTAPIEIKIPNPDHKLKPGMFAKMNVLTKEKKNVLMIPKDAIVKEDGSAYVFVVCDNDKVRRQKIETGLIEENKVEVVDGLDKGELIVAMGNVRLKDGDTVKIIANPQFPVGSP